MPFRSILVVRKKNKKYNQKYNFWPIDRYEFFIYTARRYTEDTRQGGAPAQHELPKMLVGAATYFNLSYFHVYDQHQRIPVLADLRNPRHQVTVLFY